MKLLLLPAVWLATLVVGLVYHPVLYMLIGEILMPLPSLILLALDVRRYG